MWQWTAGDATCVVGALAAGCFLRKRNEAATSAGYSAIDRVRRSVASIGDEPHARDEEGYMKLPIDIATRVSRHLSTLIDKIVSDTNREQPPTLANVRTAVLNRMTAGRRPDSMHPQQSASMLEEVEGLIDEFGGDALAIDFVAAKASEGLSRIIEVAMDNPIVRHEPTLGGVRDAMAAGLTARLVGDGIIDPDEDQTLLAEIDGLIERHGRDAVAEDFVRFE